jgi:hypothetical protein
VRGGGGGGGRGEGKGEGVVTFDAKAFEETPQRSGLRFVPCLLG